MKRRKLDGNIFTIFYCDLKLLKLRTIVGKNSFKFHTLAVSDKYYIVNLRFSNLYMQRNEFNKQFRIF